MFIGLPGHKANSSSHPCLMAHLSASLELLHQDSRGSVGSSRQRAKPLSTVGAVFPGQGVGQKGEREGFGFLHNPARLCCPCVLRAETSWRQYSQLWDLDPFSSRGLLQETQPARLVSLLLII